MRPGAVIAIDPRPLNTVIVVDRPDALSAYLPDWESLAAHALEPNVFYEPWMLLPAWRALGANRDIRVVLVFRSDPSGLSDATTLCGVFPLLRERRYREFPVRVFRLWKHDHCFLSTPLLHREDAAEALSAFFDWLISDRSLPGLIEFQYVSGDGPFSQLLIDELNRRELLSVVAERFTRALLRPVGNGTGYVEGALSAKRRKELRRLASRLSEQGRVDYVELTPQDDVQVWIEDFLRLEARGWKGADGGALAADEATREFFAAVTADAFRRNRLMMLALTLEDRPIAMKCNFVAGPGSFAYKIAYDEDYAAYSPGVQLEIENIRRLAERPQIAWMDSCAASNHFMATRLWTERRTIQTVLAATGRWPSNGVVSVLPLRVWLRQRLTRYKIFQREARC